MVGEGWSHCRAARHGAIPLAMSLAVFDEASFGFQSLDLRTGRFVDPPPDRLL